MWENKKHISKDDMLRKYSENFNKKKIVEDARLKSDWWEMLWCRVGKVRREFKSSAIMEKVAQQS